MAMNLTKRTLQAILVATVAYVGISVGFFTGWLVGNAPGWF